MVEEAYGNEKGQLGGVKLKNVKTGAWHLLAIRSGAIGAAAAALLPRGSCAASSSTTSRRVSGAGNCLPAFF